MGEIHRKWFTITVAVLLLVSVVLNWLIRETDIMWVHNPGVILLHNVVSWISLVGIAVGTMALIIVLSVYNGIGNLTQSLFNVFDPELKIEACEGKTFHTTQIPYNQILSLPQVS